MTSQSVWKAHKGHILGLCFTMDGHALVSCGMDRAISVWETAGWTLMTRFEGHEHSVNGIALSPDEQMLVSISSDRTVRLWSFPQGEPLQVLQDRKRVVSCLTLSRDGDWVVAGSYGGRVAIWSREGAPVSAFAASDKNLSTVALSPDKQRLVTGGLGAEVVVWAMPEGRRVTTLEGHQVAVLQARFINNGAQLVTLDYTGLLIVWQTANWSRVRQIEVAQETRGLAWSRDEQRVAVLQKGRVQLRQMASWEVVEEWPTSTPVVASAGFSADGRLLAVGGADGQISIHTIR